MTLIGTSVQEEEERPVERRAEQKWLQGTTRRKRNVHEISHNATETLSLIRNSLAFHRGQPIARFIVEHSTPSSPGRLSKYRASILSPVLIRNGRISLAYLASESSVT